MNIFVPYPSAKANAEMLDDLRLNKMILESAQMLCSVLHRYGVADIPYKNAYHHHPCTLWAGNTYGNAQYLLALAKWMLLEREYRGFYQRHKCSGVLDFVQKNLSVLVKGPTTPFENCTEYKHLPVHKAYKIQLVDKWKNDIKPPKWTRRGPPSFLLSGVR
jgi:hypothetical protein